MADDDDEKPEKPETSDEKLETILKPPVNVTDGEVIVHKTNGALRA